MTARAYLNDQRGSSTFIETKQVQMLLLYHIQVEPKVNQKMIRLGEWQVLDHPPQTIGIKAFQGCRVEKNTKNIMDKK